MASARSFLVCSFGARFLGVFRSGSLGCRLLLRNASMASADSAAQWQLQKLQQRYWHGANKVPKRATWWKWDDALRTFVMHLAMEFLLRIVRPLPISARCSLHDMYRGYWRANSTMLVWQDIWVLLRLEQRAEFLRRTLHFDFQFGLSMLDYAYASRMCRFSSFQELD